MNVPTLQQLQKMQDPMNLSNQQILILKVAAGLSSAHIARRHGYNSLVALGLLDEQYQITFLGKMQLSEILENKKKKK